VKRPTSIRISQLTDSQIRELADLWGMNQTEVIAVSVDRARREEVKTIVVAEYVKVEVGGVRCPVHGVQRDAEYAQQDPAPCGCAWVWDEARARLEAVPSRVSSIGLGLLNG
jgi:type IV pilus biogenesis protein CpaD/CtpE